MPTKDHLMGRNISLDFFRGVMALCVCIGHFFYWNYNPIVPVSFILSVDFFLVLSGFVLTHSVLNSKNFDSMIFFKKRYLRLFPVYIFCVIVSVLIFFLWKKPPSPNLFDIFRIVTISEMIPLNPRSNFPLVEPLGVAYTISSELYVGVIFFPIIYIINNNFKQLLFPFLFMITLYCLIILNNTSINFMDAHHRLYNLFIDYSIIRCLLDYSIGVIGYLISSRIESNKYIGVFQVAIIAFICYVFVRTHYDRNYEFLAPFMFMILIFLLSLKTGIVFKITSNKFGEFMGDISYPLYLIHPILILVSKNFYKNHNNFIPFIYVVLCLIFSYFINLLVEKPSIKYFGRK